MTAGELKAAILQAAVRGELKETKPPASCGDDLFDAKARRRKDAKGMACAGPYNLSDLAASRLSVKEIEEGEREDVAERVDFFDAKAQRRKDAKDFPFPIPAGWKWVKLGEVCEAQLGKMLDKTKNVGKAFKYLANQNVQWGGFNTETLKETFFTDSEIEKFRLQKGDLLVCEGGIPGRCAIWNEENSEIKFQKALHRLRPVKALSQYIFIYFQWVVGQKWYQSYLTGSTIKHLPRERLVNLPIPLPPLDEQRRIVAKVEELMPLVEEFGRCEEQLRTMDAAFPAQMKAAVLQAAVRGELLSPVDFADDADFGEGESGQKNQRGKRIKEGVDSFTSFTSFTSFPLLKTQADFGVRFAKLGEVSPADFADCADFPFPIPTAWKWVKLGEVCELLSGRDTEPSQYNSMEKGIPYITGASNLIKDKIVVNRWIEHPVVVSHKGDLLISCKGTVGVMVFNDIGDIHIARQIMALSSKGQVDLAYLKIVLGSKINDLKAAAKSMIPGIARKDLLNLPIPLPPLDEQRRIVAKVEELFSQIDTLAS